jgi:hypothetical protein
MGELNSFGDANDRASQTQQVRAKKTTHPFHPLPFFPLAPRKQIGEPRPGKPLVRRCKLDYATVYSG